MSMQPLTLLSLSLAGYGTRLLTLLLSTWEDAS